MSNEIGNEELVKLLKENIEISHKTLQAAEKTRRSLFLMSVSSWVRTLIWLAPLILAAIYLPRFIATIEGRVNALTGSGGARQLQGLFEQFQNSPDLQRAVDEFRRAAPSGSAR